MSAQRQQAEVVYPTVRLAEGSTATPHALAMTVFGSYILRRGVAIASSSVIDILGALGHSEAAVRSMIARLVSDGLLIRHRRGRRTFFSLTEKADDTIAEGLSLLWTPVDHPWDGTWTLLAFSFPESWQRARHELRARLHLGRFGRLQSGLWIAPSRVDVPTLLRGLDFVNDLRVFTARPEPPLDVPTIIREAFDLSSLSDEYGAIIRRWKHITPANVSDPLAARILLRTEWFDAFRQDPRLPLAHLPAEWPAVTADRIVRRLDDQLKPFAERDAADRIETVAL